MKLSKRVLAVTCMMAVAASTLTATFASADEAYEVTKHIATVTGDRQVGYGVSVDQVYSTVKEIPDDPFVGISVQMAGYTYRNSIVPESAAEYSKYGDTANNSATFYLNGTKYAFSCNTSSWAYLNENSLCQFTEVNGIKTTDKRGDAKTIGVTQPDGLYYYYDASGNQVSVDSAFEELPEGTTIYVKTAQVNDATIGDPVSVSEDGTATYVTSIVGHDFTTDTIADNGGKGDNYFAGFRMLKLISNIGYFDGKVNTKSYSVDATELKSAISEVEAYLPVKQAELEDLKNQLANEEATTEAEATTESDDTTAEAVETTTEAEATTAAAEDETTLEEKIAETEAQIAELESALADAKTAAAADGDTLDSDFDLAVNNIKINLYDSAETYSAKTPDRTVSVSGFLTSSEEGATKYYNFTQYDLINEYSKVSSLDALTGRPSTSVKDDNGNSKGYITGTLQTNTREGESFYTVTGLDYLGSSDDPNNPAGATIAMPKYALEITFEVNNSETAVFNEAVAVDNASTALTTAMADAGGVIVSELKTAIENAKANYSASDYITESFANLTAAIEAGEALLAKYEADSSSVTQDEINAAVAAIEAAILALEPLDVSGGDTGDESSDTDSSSGTSSSGSDSTTTSTSNGGTTATDSNPSTGAGVAVSAATALLVGAGFVISRKKRK